MKISWYILLKQESIEIILILFSYLVLWECDICVHVNYIWLILIWVWCKITKVRSWSIWACFTHKLISCYNIDWTKSAMSLLRLPWIHSVLVDNEWLLLSMLLLCHNIRSLFSIACSRCGWGIWIVKELFKFGSCCKSTLPILQPMWCFYTHIFIICRHYFVLCTVKHVCSCF